MKYYVIYYANKPTNKGLDAYLQAARIGDKKTGEISLLYSTNRALSAATIFPTKAWASRVLEQIPSIGRGHAAGVVQEVGAETDNDRILKAFHFDNIRYVEDDEEDADEEDEDEDEEELPRKHVPRSYRELKRDLKIVADSLIDRIISMLEHDLG